MAECTFSGRAADAREQVIAERVFGRNADFQANQDTIVRAEARNLRKRLDLFFSTEGQNEPVVITMPKGGYLLAFESRPVESLVEFAPLAAVESEIITSEIFPPSAPLKTANYARLCLILALCVVGASGLALYFHSKEAALRNQLGIRHLTLPFSALFSPAGEALVVTSDTGMLQIARVANRQISLDDYIARSYPDVPHIAPPDLIRNWNIFEFTDGREMEIAGLILRSHAQFVPRIALRSGHQVQLQDFKDKSAILIGSPVSNPWAQLYEDKLNFRCSMDSSGRIVFHNLDPRHGEAAQYPTEDDFRHHNYTYARLALVPKTSDGSAALLIAGTTAQATQAAGELAVDQTRLDRILRKLGIDPSSQPRFFEIMIRSNTFVGGAISPELIMARTAPVS